MSEAVEALSRLGSTSKDALYSAGNIREDLAKAWANGQHNVVRRKLQYGEEHTVTEKNGYDLAGKGMTVERAVNYFADCLEHLKSLSKALDTVPDKEAAKQLFDGWDKVRAGHSLYPCEC